MGGMASVVGLATIIRLAHVVRVLNQVLRFCDPPVWVGTRSFAQRYGCTQDVQAHALVGQPFRVLET
jgi:hypothetical protein